VGNPLGIKTLSWHHTRVSQCTVLAPPRYSRPPPPLLGLIQIYEKRRHLEVAFNDPSSQTLRYGATPTNPEIAQKRA